MEVNPYRVLVQLIPGSLFLGIILINEIGVLEMGLLGAGTITFLALLAIIFGYVFNGIGHFFEMLVFKKCLERRIQRNLNNSKNGGPVVRFFRYFSVIRMDEIVAEETSVSQTARLYNQESRVWSKEENKFARTLLITSVLLLIYVYFRALYCMNDQTRLCVRALLWSLFSISLYRYMVSSIDYSYKRRNKTT